MGHLGLRLDDLRFHFLRISLHFLFFRDGHRTAFLRFRLRDALVRLGLVGHQLRADVAPDVHVRDVD